MDTLSTGVTRNVVVAAEGLSKAYELYRRPIDLVKEVVTGRRHHDLFWALRDISFEIQERERVGIIGPNGAGKSTLLQIISGNLAPTSGRIRVEGRISALLSLTPSWNLDETGLENIRFNLLLQGCSSREVARLTEEIIDFTELGPFIHRPVRTYSSGMSARLAFAIGTAVTPEILIVDEVLGVGDAYFVAKANRRMVELCEKGRALLFVSHSPDAVQRLCDKVIWIQDGAIRLAGPTEYVLKRYEEDFRKREDEAIRGAHIARRHAATAHASLDDVIGEDSVRLRIAAGDGQALAETHYVRHIETVIGGTEQTIGLGLLDPASDAVAAALDVLGSEWGRLYERGGFECRVLCHNSARRRGGQFIIRRPAEGGTVPIEVAFEAAADNPGEPLTVELLDAAQATWTALGSPETEELGGGWQRVRVRGVLPVWTAEQITVAREAIAARERPAIEIAEVRLVVDGQRSERLREGQPFAIEVRLRAHRPVPLADVGLKLTRSDGIYAFWQSSGFTRNLEDLSDEAVVRFVFAENPFGAGDYLVNALVANGWDIERNYPYSEVFSRRIGVLSFNIAPEHPGLDMGVVNVRARIEIERN
jgi:lipopolysaccharide transport system ATP-binding protein